MQVLQCANVLVVVRFTFGNKVRGPLYSVEYRVPVQLDTTEGQLISETFLPPMWPNEALNGKFVGRPAGGVTEKRDQPSRMCPHFF